MGNNNSEHINEVMNSQVADSAPVATMNELKSKTSVNDQTAYVIADAYTENPTKLLGRVIEVRKNSKGECPTSLVRGEELNYEFSVTSLKGFKIDDQTRNSKPLLRGSILVDRDICVNAGFLNFLSGQLKQNESFNLIVMDQAKGLIDTQDESWDVAVDAWKDKNKEKLNDPEICYIYVVTEFVQKNIIKKKYSRFEAGARGGAYGINIDGKLSTSTDEYSLDIIFGLTPSILKRPSAEVEVKGRAVTEKKNDPSIDELRLFARTTGTVLNGMAIAAD